MSTASTTTNDPPKADVPVKEFLFKLLVVGDLGTGKTSIIKRYVHQIFSMHYKSTIGVDFALKVLQYSPEVVVRLQLWDIAGQERFGNMTRVYYKEAVGALVVFDITRVSTFEGVSKWKQDLDEKVRLLDGSEIPVVLLANKVDLAKEQQAVVPTKEQLEKYCEEKGFIGFFETSAKDNLNIDEAMRLLVSKVLENDAKLLVVKAQAAAEKKNLVRPGRAGEGSGPSSLNENSNSSSCCN